MSRRNDNPSEPPSCARRASSRFVRHPLRYVARWIPPLAFCPPFPPARICASRVGFAASRVFVTSRARAVSASWGGRLLPRCARSTLPPRSRSTRLRVARSSATTPSTPRRGPRRRRTPPQTALTDLLHAFGADADFRPPRAAKQRTPRGARRRYESARIGAMSIVVYELDPETTRMATWLSPFGIEDASPSTCPARTSAGYWGVWRPAASCGPGCLATVYLLFHGFLDVIFGDAAGLNDTPGGLLRDARHRGPRESIARRPRTPTRLRSSTRCRRRVVRILRRR